MGHEPIAYTYEADVHCPACAEDRFGRNTVDGLIAVDSSGSPAEDSEGNPVGVIAPWDEWWDLGDDEVQYLQCGTCHKVIESVL